MENVSKLMLIGFGASLFAGAVLLTILMYYGVTDIWSDMCHYSPIRGIMEGVR